MVQNVRRFRQLNKLHIKRSRSSSGNCANVLNPNTDPESWSMAGMAIGMRGSGTRRELWESELPRQVALRATWWHSPRASGFAKGPCEPKAYSHELDARLFVWGQEINQWESSNMKKYRPVIQHSYWKWPFIVSFPIKNGGSFHSYVSHYQRVPQDSKSFSHQNDLHVGLKKKKNAIPGISPSSCPVEGL